MNKYFDKDLMIVGDTLMQVSPDFIHRTMIRIEPRMGSTGRRDGLQLQADNVRVRRIGAGALMGKMKGLHEVVIAEGIEEVGPRSFADNKRIERLVLPESLKKCGENAFTGTEILKLEIRRSLSRQAYDRIKSEALEVTGGELLLRQCYSDEPGMEDMAVLYSVLNDNRCGQHAAELDERMHCIFVERFDRNDNEVLEKQYPLEGLPAMGEQQYIKRMIVEKWDDLVFTQSEEYYDQALGNDIGVHLQLFNRVNTCGMISFDDSNTVFKDDGRVSVLFEYVVGLAYWYTSLPVIYKGRFYYIVRKHFMKGSGKTVVFVRDHGVYDDNGMPCSKEMTQIIYGKYRFLSLLV